MRNNKKSSLKRNKKITKNEITVDEVMIQSALIMVRTISEAEKEGASVLFETEVDGINYDVDISIKIKKDAIHKRIINFFTEFYSELKLLWNLATNK